MPAILPPEAFDLWLDCNAVDALTAAAFLVPPPDALLEAHEVSSAVNRVANDGPALIAPLKAGPAEAPEQPAKRTRRKPQSDDRQPSLFPDT